MILYEDFYGNKIVLHIQAIITTNWRVKAIKKLVIYQCVKKRIQNIFQKLNLLDLMEHLLRH